MKAKDANDGKTETVYAVRYESFVYNEPAEGILPKLFRNKSKAYAAMYDDFVKMKENWSEFCDTEEKKGRGKMSLYSYEDGRLDTYKWEIVKMPLI